MAAKTKTQIIRYAPPRAVAPIIRVSAPRAAPHKNKHHHHRHNGGALTKERLFATALGGALYGFIEKSIGPSLPAIPLLGRAGTITIGAFMFAKGKGGGIVADIARAGAVLCGYQIGTTGKISGEEMVVGNVVPQVSGVAAQV